MCAKYAAKAISANLLFESMNLFTQIQTDFTLVSFLDVKRNSRWPKTSEGILQIVILQSLIKPNIHVRIVTRLSIEIVT